MRPFLGALVVVLLAAGFGLAETYSGKYVHVKEGKITIRFLGKAANPEDLNRTFPLANNVEVRHAKVNNDPNTGKIVYEDGAVIEGGLRAPLFTDETLNKNLWLMVTLEDVQGKSVVTKVHVVPRAKKGAD